MKKINTQDYFINVQGGDGTIMEIPYNVKESLIGCLFHPELKLGGREIIERDLIAKKIDSAEEHILLENAEYQKLLHAFETVKGFGKSEVELVKRVFNAEDIIVKEA